MGFTFFSDMVSFMYSVSADTPYEGGIFKMKLVLGKDFPQSPPRGFFLTKIFHPNVSKNGEICVNTLKKDWKPDLGLKHILIVSTLLSLLRPLWPAYGYLYIYIYIYIYSLAVIFVH